MYFGWNCGTNRASYWMAQMNDIRIFDWSALGITAAAFLEYLPSISAGLSAIWILLRIIQTVSEMRNGRRD